MVDVIRKTHSERLFMESQVTQPAGCKHISEVMSAIDSWDIKRYAWTHAGGRVFGPHEHCSIIIRMLPKTLRDKAVTDLPDLIERVYKTLANVGSEQEPRTDRPVPAVPAKQSVTPDYIICLEDGKKLKMLKRHLKTAYNLTPEEYRERWELPPDYPMVSPNYAKQRSKLAKEIGLGTRSRRGGE